MTARSSTPSGSTTREGSPGVSGGATRAVERCDRHEGTGEAGWRWSARRGLAGAELVRQALEGGHAVVALARDPKRVAVTHANLTSIRADVLGSSVRVAQVSLTGCGRGRSVGGGIVGVSGFIADWEREGHASACAGV
jgi:hypothetical protein